MSVMILKRISCDEWLTWKYLSLGTCLKVSFDMTVYMSLSFCHLLRSVLPKVPISLASFTICIMFCRYAFEGGCVRNILL